MSEAERLPTSKLLSADTTIGSPLTIAHLEAVKPAYIYEEIKPKFEQAFTGLREELLESMKDEILKARNGQPVVFSEHLMRSEAEQKAIRRFESVNELVQQIKEVHPWQPDEMKTPEYIQSQLKLNILEGGNFDLLRKHFNNDDILLDKNFGDNLQRFLDEKTGKKDMSPSQVPGF